MFSSSKACTYNSQKTQCNSKTRIFCDYLQFDSYFQCRCICFCHCIAGRKNKHCAFSKLRQISSIVLLCYVVYHVFILKLLDYITGLTRFVVLETVRVKRVQGLVFSEEKNRRNNIGDELKPRIFSSLRLDY